MLGRVAVSVHKLISEQIEPHHVGTRTESAALLAWFLQTVWRMEDSDVDESICDGGGDKGIDALVVEDELGEITILQSKWKKKASGEQGDKDLKNLVGAERYFASEQAVDELLRSKPNQELIDLIARNDVRRKVADGAHVNRLVFVTNGKLNSAGRDYEKAANAGGGAPFEVWDAKRLGPIARRTKRPELRPDEVKLVGVAPAITTSLDNEVDMAVTLVPASQLVALKGIDDLTLFDRNVRLGLGKTRINQELETTIQEKSEHPLFPAYHNGLTVLTHDLGVRGKTVRLKGIAVVNGCQSLLSLYRNSAAVTKSLNILVRVVQVDTHSDLPDQITYRTNNQNSVDIRDQRSRDAIQRELQAEVADVFKKRFGYAIRRGEKIQADEVLPNERAAQLIMAVYLKEPWNAVRKVLLFDEEYRSIFNRTINAHKLYLLHCLDRIVEDRRDDLRDDLAASFASVRLTLVYLVAELLRLSKLGEQLLESPEKWLPTLSAAVQDKAGELADEVIESVNFFVEEEQAQAAKQDKTFDPKIAFKRRDGVRRVRQEVVKSAKRQQKRDKKFLFAIKAA
jgi:hypothetical protein